MDIYLRQAQDGSNSNLLFITPNFPYPVLERTKQYTRIKDNTGKDLFLSNITLRKNFAIKNFEQRIRPKYQ